MQETKAEPAVEAPSATVPAQVLPDANEIATEETNEQEETGPVITNIKAEKLEGPKILGKN